MKNLKTTITILTLAVFSIFSGYAQKSANSLLWKIEGDDIKTSYVFGTFHMLPKEDFILKDKVTTAFDVAEIITFELDMDDASLQGEMMKESLIKDGGTLKPHMDEKEYAILDTYFKEKMGVGMENFNNLKPFVVSSMVMMNFLGENIASYEFSLLSRAKEQQKDVQGLETVAFQMSMFDKQPYNEQVDEIIKLLTETNEMQSLFEEMIALYNTEDIDELYDYMDEYFGSEQLMDRLLHERNANWIPKIGLKSKDQSVFYAVGAGHLGGDQGVVSLLKKAGYTVTPIMD